MKALVFNGPRDIRYEEYPDPSLSSENAVILKVSKCSICGSDLHIYHGDAVGQRSYAGELDKFCVGHEFIGEVVEAGAQVHRFKVGDKVLSAAGTGCGACPACATGRVSECRNVSAFGLSRALNGGQAEYVNIPVADHALCRIPDGVSDEQALLLTDAMATAAFGIANAAIQPGDDVAVVGLGPIGLLSVELAFLAGAARVFAVDPIAARQAQAVELGAEAFAPENALEQMLDRTRGRGASKVLEASGASAAAKLALTCTARGGTLSLVGLPQPTSQLSLAQILYKNITVKAGVAPVTLLWARLISLLQGGRLKADRLFSHHMKLSEGARAYELFDSRSDGVLKILIEV